MRGRGPMLLLLCLAACARGEPAPGTAAAPPATSAPEEAPAASATPAERVAMPGPRRARLGAAAARDAECAICHEEEAAAWRGSRHHLASTNAAFRAAFAIEPSPFCRGCHAPEADPAAEPPRAVLELGVGCVTCHVTEEGVVLAAARAGAGDDAPHPLRRSAGFAGPGACAGCHEFPFPAAMNDDDEQLMQTTVREHRRSASAEKSCAACHMPIVEGRRSHAFAMVRDPAWMRDMLQATAERTADGVRVTLAQKEPGHGFPTGDLFRRLEVGCEARAESGAVAPRSARHLARHFQLLPGRSGRVLVRDDRVFDEPVAVELPGCGRGRARWWVTYQRVATVGTGRDPADAKIESEIELHAGDLP